MRYNEAMNYITQVGNFGSNYGLERTERLLELLGNPHKKIKSIHVAGTNGKGSTTAMITKILSFNGYKIGMYTSPFLEEFEERIQINGENIPKDKLGELMDTVKEAVDKVIAEGLNHPTEFEIITCLMFYYFYKENVDFAVVEVGLGGRLDSTNVINPLVSVITSISFDHTNLLGNTLREIAGEKAGIIKYETPVVIFPQEKEAYDVIKDTCIKHNSKLYEVNKDCTEFVDIIVKDKTYQRIKVKLDDIYEFDLSLLGEHQILNSALALKVIEVLKNLNYINVEKEAIKNALSEVVWKGRLEILYTKPLVVIDGAHNIQGITKLKENIHKYFNYNKLHLILGILSDKDVEHMVEVITPLAEKVYCVTPNSIRAELAKDLEKEVLRYNSSVEAFDDYKNAFISAYKSADKGDLILASGSLYMIGEMRGIINNTINS